MEASTIIQLIGLALTGAKTAFDMKVKSTPPKDFKQPLIDEIRQNVAVLDTFFRAKPKKKSRGAMNEVVQKLKKDSYDKLISEYADLKKAFGKKKTKLQHEHLFESIHLFYYKIGELKDLIDFQNIRPNVRMRNIRARGHDIIRSIDKKNEQRCKPRRKNEQFTR